MTVLTAIITFLFDEVANGISKVIVYGLDGDDDIKIHKNVGARGWLFGGGGNDKLRGGDQVDVLVDDGDDGDDQLDGQKGRDLLIGGDGADKLKGHQDDDVLIAGATAYDNQLTALCGIMAEWSNASSFENRVLNLFTGGGSTSGYQLNSSTVTVSDGDRDDLNGASGLDWY
ncbi:MAG: Ca2+-binding RTX toxin-like protein, partial [Pirellulaceae bacterium]